MATAEPHVHDQAPRLPDPLSTIEHLNAELQAGNVRLPSFPDIVARIQRVLEDPRAAPGQIARVAGADAALAARILSLANSAFLNPSGKDITDMQQAVTRLGHQLVRCTAVSFALQQMKFGEGDAMLRRRLRDMWRIGTLVASIAYVLAKETRAANPDEALVAGLMHNVGQLYIAVNAGDGADRTDEAWSAAVHAWHPRLARAILLQWKLPSAIIEAVAHQNNMNAETDTPADLTDVLVTATALVPLVFYRASLSDTITSLPSFHRLQLAVEDCQRLLSASAQQIRALQTALAG